MFENKQWYYMHMQTVILPKQDNSDIMQTLQAVEEVKNGTTGKNYEVY